MAKHLAGFRIVIRTEGRWVNGYCCHLEEEPNDDCFLLFQVRTTAMDMGGPAAFEVLQALARVLSEGMMQHAIPEAKHEDISIEYVAPGGSPNERH